MARFDIFEPRSGGGYLLDCQADILRHLNTRFCIPLMSPDEAPIAGERLNPEFEIEGAPFRMVTQFAAAIPVRELGLNVGSLADEHATIMNAIDMLTTGF
nr:CcdB family protein [uncultured Sphingosinicella sp.]